MDLFHGMSDSHSRYVRVTLYSPDCCCMNIRRDSCFFATFSTSGGSSARRSFSRSSSISSSPDSPSSARICFICCERMYSRSLLLISCWAMEVISFFTFRTSS